MAQQSLQLFTRDLQRVLFQDNSILDLFATEQGAIAINGTVGTVVRPQAGAFAGGIQVNPTYPLTPASITDDVLTYLIDYYVSNPTLIADIDSYLLNYDKRAHIIDQHAQTLKSTMLAKTFYKMGVTGASKIVRTTGTNRPATAPTATGTRKALTEADIISARDLYVREKTESEYGANRALFLPECMYTDIIAIKDFISYEKVGVPNQYQGYKPIGTIYGFPVYTRINVAIYDNGATTACVVKDFNAATQTTTGAAVTDNEAAYMVNLNTFVVAKEASTFRFDSEESKVINGGTYYNAKGFFGGSFKRTNKEGVIAIVQVA
jgi:hypothetical protein